MEMQFSSACACGADVMYLGDDGLERGRYVLRSRLRNTALQVGEHGRWLSAVSEDHYCGSILEQKVANVSICPIISSRIADLCYIEHRDERVGS